MGDDQEVCSACQLLRPATPPPESCCGSGCALCVFDIHDQELGLWKKNCRRKHGSEVTIDGTDENASAQSTMDPLEYRQYVLESIRPVCVNADIYRFTLPAGTSLDLAIAKHIILRGTVNNRCITRQYTPISVPGARGYFDVLIKLYDNGEMSQYIRQWQVGDQIEWRGTFGTFTYQPNETRCIMMLAAGTGITPLIQVMRHIVEDEKDETVVRLRYSCRSYPEILLRDELNELALFWNVSVIYHVSQESEDSHPTEYGETIHHERITKEVIHQEVHSVASQSVRALVCGTRTFEDDMIGFLLEAGVDEQCVTRF